MSLSQKITAPIRFLVDSRPVDRLLQVFDHRTDNRMTERGMLSHAFEFKSMNEVEGDYFEFGLWRGKTFLYAHRMRRRYRQKKMLMWGSIPSKDCRESRTGRTIPGSRGSMLAGTMNFVEFCGVTEFAKLITDWSKGFIKIL